VVAEASTHVIAVPAESRPKGLGEGESDQHVCRFIPER
jgi:hypothetical protein